MVFVTRRLDGARPEGLELSNEYVFVATKLQGVAMTDSSPPKEVVTVHRDDREGDSLALMSENPFPDVVGDDTAGVFDSELAIVLLEKVAESVLVVERACATEQGLW